MPPFVFDEPAAEKGGENAENRSAESDQKSAEFKSLPAHEFFRFLGNRAGKGLENGEIGPCLIPADGFVVHIDSQRVEKSLLLKLFRGIRLFFRFRRRLRMLRS